MLPNKTMLIDKIFRTVCGSKHKTKNGTTNKDIDIFFLMCACVYQLKPKTLYILNTRFPLDANHQCVYYKENDSTKSKVPSYVHMTGMALSIAMTRD
jgi:hypothetical protein